MMAVDEDAAEEASEAPNGIIFPRPGNLTSRLDPCCMMVVL